MPTWDLEETRNLVRHQFGNGDQLDRSRECLGSVIDRCEHARFHYHEVRGILTNKLTCSPGESKLIALFGGKSREEQREFDSAVGNVSAHVVACVQSLHAIADIFAHAIYYSLGINLSSHPLNERKVGMRSVMERLQSVPSYRSLGETFGLLSTHEHQEYLNALANHSKHRSLVKPGLWLDMTSSASENFSLKFQRFEYEGIRYEEREVERFLEVAFNRISKIIVDTGNELNEVLRQAKGSN
ncbi:hypothetical protein [Cupriavidus sp. L7L]|uniref:hypothetical protein n=1 Tax=Cupriavidus sp. L7L TaxID=2546443 RepID=UPI0010552D5A|nr:hypothetical protein [Cupriavidus sp. L7L]TDF62227.1 hypothetical protein E1J61_30710 [Cupriavidus sp. L7L]